MVFVALALVAAVCSIFATIAVRSFAWRFRVLDMPRGERKIHAKPIPLLGGCAVFISFACVVLGYLYFIQKPSLIDSHVQLVHIMGILLAGLVLVVGGALDDRFNLKPYHQIIAPLLAVGIVIAAGIGVSTITNPFTHQTVSLAPWSPLVTAVWLLTTIYTTKFLDGLDGLVSGMTVIGALIIGFLSLFFFVNIPTALLAFIVVGVFAGFFVFNFHPASIFLGEAGSTFAGFMLGVLAILSGAKFATALLILGIPVLDAAWVIFRRVVIEKRSPFKADRKHIHFRLLDAGLSHRQAVLLLYAVSATFGMAALFMQSTQKLIALALVLVLMLILAAFLLRIEKLKAISYGTHPRKN
ncbi:MAG: MraY family glycosyltransferase [bacterium]|nr:MraY family glycosyltransferase [bacterium]